MKTKILKLWPAVLALVLGSAVAAQLSLPTNPISVSNSVPPNVLFSLSVEWPMAGAAYPDQPETAADEPDPTKRCPGRGTDESSHKIGNCYFKDKTYIGYFDAGKCYTYGGGKFTAASGSYGAPGYSCGGKWSGNFLNWATMSAIDEFRMAMTGGNRIVDTASQTTLQRANIDTARASLNGGGVFPVKRVGAGTPGAVSPGSVTPYGDAVVYVYSHGTQIDVGNSAASLANLASALNVQVDVCGSAAEANCKPFGSSLKPTGVIQNNATKMRFGATSYLLDISGERDGGVLRARMKYAGPQKFVAGSGWQANANAEWDANGIFLANPDATDATASAVGASGLINYVNKFGGNGYKGYDPVGELYYEGLNYFKHRGRTPEYIDGDGGVSYAAASAAMLDGFPAIKFGTAAADDPIQNWCQKNFIIGINDANPWFDKKLPGTSFTSALPNTSSTVAGATGTKPYNAHDWGQPSNADSSINVTTLTDQVGTLEGLNGTTQCFGGDSSNYDNSTVSATNAATFRSLPGLGQVAGTCPSTGKQNTYYVAGLAYYANTTDIRPDLSGGDPKKKVTVSTFMIDTQEYSANPLLGNMNMLWLAGKYGGFVDSNGDANPGISVDGTDDSEWDADGDGIPDNYVFANRPEKMIDGLGQAVGKVLSLSTSSAGLASNSTSLSSGSATFQAGYDSGDWTGRLEAYALLPPNGTLATTASWSAGTVLTGMTPAQRTIITFNDDNSVRAGRPFAWSGISAAEQALLDKNPTTGSADGKGSKRLDYLRGARGDESPNGQKFRQRNSLLGDIVNSSPVFVGAPNADIADPTYLTFKTAQASRTHMIYVGANDGMLHGFAESDGKEKLAYVPSKVYANLNQLTSARYTHRFFVDATPVVGDVKVGSTWKSALVGGLGRGGQGVYALNVTSPASFAETNAAAASTVMWEFTDKDDADLGYTYGTPQIVKMANGKWAAILGNGYNNSEADGSASTTGHAALFILFMDGPNTSGAWVQGSHYVKLDTQVGTPGSPNGMATPLWVDSNLDGTVDYIYAGDLQGNLWKFDVSDANSANWKPAFGTTAAPLPLFTAKDSSNVPQPITSKPIATTHPGGGLLILVGTGKYLELTDTQLPFTTQSFYGIWDKKTPSVVSGRSALQAQAISGTTPLSGRTFRSSANSTVDWSTQRGWYMDLPDAGERVIYDPKLLFGNVHFATLVPNTTDPCAGGGTGSLMILDPLTGGATSQPAFDTNNDGAFTGADGRYVGETSSIGIPTPPVAVRLIGTEKFKYYANGSSGRVEKVGNAKRKTRDSWREIIKQ